MMDWTRPDTRAEVIELWSQGLSASLIGARLGCSRNAVIGAVHRMGLPHRKERHAPAIYIKRQRLASAPVILRPKIKTEPPPEKAAELKAIAAMAPIDPGLTVLGLSEFTCRYPIGDPQAKDFAFCGRTCESEHAYCAPHAKLCYTPVDPKRAKGTARLANWLDRANFTLAA